MLLAMGVGSSVGGAVIQGKLLIWGQKMGRRLFMSPTINASTGHQVFTSTAVVPVVPSLGSEIAPVPHFNASCCSGDPFCLRADGTRRERGLVCICEGVREG